MKKHIYGFALFLFIVSSSIIIYRFLNAPQVQRTGFTSHSQTDHSDHSHARPKPAGLTCEISSIVLDVKEDYGIATVTFHWNSNEPPPKGLMVDFGITTTDKPLEGFQIGVARIGTYWHQNKMTEKVVFRLNGRADVLDPLKKYYGYVEASDWKGGDSVKLIYREKDRMNGAMPVVVKNLGK